MKKASAFKPYLSHDTDVNMQLEVIDSAYKSLDLSWEHLRKSTK